jgi:hypothetical protein
VIRVILLNGGSSSGKTGIARCLQAILPQPWIRLGVDDLVDALQTGLAASRFTEAGCAVFTQYLVVRNDSYPLFPVARRMADDVLEALPAQAANMARHYLLPPATMILARLSRTADDGHPSADQAGARRTRADRPT